jgi:opacity protein-like surface antigen
MESSLDGWSVAGWHILQFSGKRQYRWQFQLQLRHRQTNWRRNARLQLAASFLAEVVGFESEGGYLKLGSSGAIPYSSGTGWNTRSTTHVGDWYGSLSGRLGIAWDRLLFYFKGGVGFTNIAGAVTDNCSAAPCSASLLVATESSRQPFWVAGAGIEYAVPNTPWSIKGEAFILRYVQILRGLRPG